MKLLKRQKRLRSWALTILSLGFAIGTLSASYHPCDMEPPTQQQAQAEMAEMDCASMDMGDDHPAKFEKQCCVDFSCPKCFSSPLTTALQETVAAPVEHAAVVRGDVHNVVSHLNSGIDRPPKCA